MIEFRYKILHEINLVLQYYKGNLNSDFMIEKNSEMFRDDDFNPEYNGITIFWDVSFTEDFFEIKKYSDFITKNQSLYSKRQVAVLTDTPNQAATATLFKQFSGGTPMSYEVFSTLDRAIKWLNLPNDKFEVIKNAMQEIKKGG